MAEAPSFLTPWSNFYIMTGSSAAALTGLMFVVITLVTESNRRRDRHFGISTFSTPTVVHFGVSLFVSALLSAPWHSLLHVAIVVGLVGLFGVAYILRVMVRVGKRATYTPDLEDWTFYSILPLGAYVVLLGSAIAIPAAPVQALFALAGGVLLLIFIGIHNAWDIVTFLVAGDAAEQPEAASNDEEESTPQTP